MRVHISIQATDLERSRNFYASLFGQPASKVKDDYLNFRLDEPSIHLALVQNDAAQAPAHQHFGVELPNAESFQDWEKRALAAEEATAVVPEPGAKCCYAKADKVWAVDPDGHRWEIWYRTGEHDALGEEPPASPAASSCC